MRGLEGIGSPRFYKTGRNGFLAETREEDEIFTRMFQRASAADPKRAEKNKSQLRQFGTYTFTPPEGAFGKHAKVEFLTGSRSDLQGYMTNAVLLFSRNNLQPTGSFIL